MGIMNFGAAPAVMALAVALGLDDSGLKKGLKSAKADVKGAADDLDTKAKRLQKGAQKLAPAALAVMGGIALGAKKSISAASDLDEAMNKSSRTFGKFAKDMPGMNSSVAKSLGLSRSAALDGAAGIGSMTIAMGASKKEAAKMSTQILKNAADLGSFHNADPTDMLDRLRAGLSGESEPLKRFGILLTEQRVKLQAVKMGLAGNIRQSTKFKEVQMKVEDATKNLIDAQREHGKNSDEAKKAQLALNKVQNKADDILQGQGISLDENAKQMARFALIQKDGAIAADDFSKTSGGLANQQRILQNQLEDLAAELGKGLLPAATKVAGVMIGFISFLSKHQWVVKTLVAVLGTFAVVVLATAASMKIAALAQTFWTGVTGAATAAQWLFNAAVAANPVMLLVIALAALAVGLVVAYKKSDKFRKLVNKMFGALEKSAKAVLSFFKHHWKKIALFISGPFIPLVALATDAFGIRSKLIRALTWLRDAAKSKAKSVALAIANALLAPIRFHVWLQRQIADKITAFLSQAKNRGAAILSSIKSGFESFSFKTAAMLQRKILDPIASGSGFIKRVVNAGARIGSNLVGGLATAVAERGKAGFNRIIRFINTLGNKITKFLPFVGDIPDIKEFARGGVVNSPTLGVFGEAGPEALIPLGKNKRSHAVPLLQRAAQAHGMQLFKFGFGGIIKNAATSAVKNLNPASAAVDTISTLYGGAKSLIGKLPSLPDRVGPMFAGNDLGRRFGEMVLRHAKAFLGRTVSSGIKKLGGLFGGGGSSGPLFKGGAFPVPGGSLGGGPSAHLARALNNWMSDDAWDIMGREGSPVLAAYSGRIGRVNSNLNANSPQFYGMSMYQSVPGGTLWYKHLKRIVVRAGQMVKAGQLLGFLGGQGVLNGGPHLHIGANPLSLFNGLPGLDRGGRVVRAGIARVHPGDVHRGERGGTMLNVDLRGARFIGSDREIARQLAQEIAPYLNERVTLQVAS